MPDWSLSTMKHAKLLVLPLLAVSVFAQGPIAKQLITGAAHMAYYVTDLAKARAYYKDFLGFDEAFVLKNQDGSDHIAFIKINDHQFIELLLEPPKNHGFLHDVAFQTADAAAVRASFAALGVKVPGVVSKDPTGDLSFEVIDPFGFTIQIVQYEPDSRTALGKGKYMPATRISTHIDHLGILINDKSVAAQYYGDVFGFPGDGDNTKRRIGDGPDRFELGFERKPQTVDRFHVKNHICLSVPDVPAIAAMLQAKPAAGKFREIETHVLDNGKHVAELYDPDGNRVELMEPPKGK
jgi:catechol 2,3-dioxygenase-like lactoylglutathione lyase family enzyme